MTSEDADAPTDQSVGEARDGEAAERPNPDQAALLSRLQSAERERDEARAERDEARAGERNLSEHARRVAAEATAAFEVVEDVGAAWEAIGLPGNRGHLTLAEQVASICRERDGALADRDALKAERDALLAALRDAVEEIEDLRRYANNNGGMYDDVTCDYGRAAIAKATGGDHGE